MAPVRVLGAAAESLPGSRLTTTKAAKAAKTSTATAVKGRLAG